jgi:rRNA maturation RNase YbeY
VTHFFYEDIPSLDVDEKKINSWINLIISQNNCVAAEINYIFCSDDYILKINNQYLKHNYFTDIITFDYCEDNKISGDVFISIDTVLSNSKTYHTSFSQELNRVIIHGILHLIGFKDKSESEAAEMRRQENIALQALETIS